MDAFHKYDNILAFFLGNENIATNDASVGAPFIKAAARDMKAYREGKKYRKIPVGYSAADIKELRPMLQDYLTCGGNTSETIEFFGLNSYSWCDPSDYERSTYNQLQEYAADFPVPIFFTETGCNVPGPRLWEDQAAIFGEKMVHDWSGAIIYEWIQEQNNYGIINYGPPVGDPTKNDETVFDNWTRKGTPTPVVPDFDNLKMKWASLTPTGVNRAAYDPGHVSTRPCPASTEGGWWAVGGNVRLPALDETVTALAASATVTDAQMTLTDPPTSASATSSAETSESSADTTDSADPKIMDENNKDNNSVGGNEGGAAAICISFGRIVFGLILWL